MHKFLIPTLFVLMSAACSEADLRSVTDVLQTAGGGAAGGLSESDIAAGLKEALATGTERAVGRIGRLDGFWQNANLRIPLPDSLKKAEKVMRQLGQSKTVDEFHLSLNRAAEQAVPEAAGIFGDAIRGMGLSDARGILQGPDDAATQYFRGRTTAPLTARFTPIVGKATASVGATRKYKDLVGKVKKLVPGFEPVDLDAYVTERALGGLFTTLAEEEKKIRENPDDVYRMVRATLRELQFVWDKANQEAVTNILMKQWRVSDRKMAGEMVRQVQRVLTKDANVKLESVQVLVDLARESAKISRPVAAAQVVDYSFVDKARKELGLAK